MVFRTNYILAQGNVWFESFFLNYHRWVNIRVGGCRKQSISYKRSKTSSYFAAHVLFRPDSDKVIFFLFKTYAAYIFFVLSQSPSFKILSSRNSDLVFIAVPDILYGSGIRKEI